jgi:8-oxo-dGTP diphosphatase
VTDATTTTEPVISAAIIVSDGRLLIVRRRVSEGALSWQFPAGAVEPGETLEEAAVRETVEEVGLVVTPDRLLGERTHPRSGRRMAYVACTGVSGDAYVADTEELDDIAWATPAQFDDYVPYGFAPMVQDYLAATLA